MCMYCRSALHMVGVGNQASSPSSKNTLRTICTSTKVEIFLLVPGHPGTTPSYAPEGECVSVDIPFRRYGEGIDRCRPGIGLPADYTGTGERCGVMQTCLLNGWNMVCSWLNARSDIIQSPLSTTCRERKSAVKFTSGTWIAFSERSFLQPFRV